MAVSGYVTSKGQTTIPKSVRDKLGLSAGSKLEWTIDGDRAVVMIGKGRAVELAGILGNPLERRVTVEEMNESIGDAIVERYERAVDRR